MAPSIQASGMPKYCATKPPAVPTAMASRILCGAVRGAFGRAFFGGRAGTSGTQPLLQAIHETLAEGHLFQGDELVGLVRLVDRAGAATDRRNAAVVEQPGIGAEGDHPGAIAAGQRLGQLGYSADGGG